MLELRGNVGVGHVRYPTAGCDGISEAQPFYVNAPYGIVLAHNGNLTNARELAEVLIREDRRHLNSTSDSEVLLNVFASELQRVGTPRVTPGDIFAALNAVYRRCRGGYAVVAMVIGHGILGFRDPNGIRPLVVGRKDSNKGPEWMLASESVALTGNGFKFVRDIGPGEAVFIDEQGRLFSQQLVATVHQTPCIFEYVYFARPDSIMDNISVYRARMRMGDKLAEKIERQGLNRDIDVVIPIPDTSRTSALQLAQRLGPQVSRRLHQEPLYRPHLHHAGPAAAREIGAPQAERHRPRVPGQERAARWMTPSSAARPLRRSSISPARLAPARCISPRPRLRCAFRTCMASTCPRPASWWPPAGRMKRMAKLIGADWLVYQDLHDLVSACRHDDAQVTEFDTSCFSGEYVTGDVTPEYLARLQTERSDEAKALRREGRSPLRWLDAPEPRIHRGSAREVAAFAPVPNQLVEPASGRSDPRRKILLDLFRAALESVDGRLCVRDALARNEAHGRPVLGCGSGQGGELDAARRARRRWANPSRARCSSPKTAMSRPRPTACRISRSLKAPTRCR